MLHVCVNTKQEQFKTFHVKCHFVGKVQLNSERNLYCCKDLKVTKNAGKFPCWYVQYQHSVGERDILLHI